LQLVAEQPAQVVQDAGLDRRVQAVAAVVDPDPVHLEAGRGPAGAGRPLQHHHPVPGPGRPVGGAHPGRPGPEDDQVDGLSQNAGQVSTSHSLVLHLFPGSSACASGILAWRSTARG
jgi:hypothetical protein